MANARVRGQHFLTLKYKDEPEDGAEMKAHVKGLMSYVKKASDKQKIPWAAKIDIYFSNTGKNKNHEWNVKVRPHIHMIIDSCPGSALINTITKWWRERYGITHLEDIMPTTKDMIAVINYCQRQAKVSGIGMWKRIIGAPLPILESETIEESLDLAVLRLGY